VSIPFSTSTISITRSSLSPTEDPYDPTTEPADTTVVSGLRAVVGVPSANPVLTIGDRIVYTTKLTCDPCDLEADDIVTDSVSGLTWVCLWAKAFEAFGLSGMEAQLRLTSGLAQ
jgi:hypothetical protein